MEFILPTMTCGHCVKAVTEAVQALDPLATVVVDLPEKKVQVQTAQSVVEVREALLEAGYAAAD
jgi:copper chaperone